ncbi:uncharacterized protein PRCAT00004755001 [Priceomyces carsonii]|uniref:uncharacterized protein n=1 Tax=Priceomyces carsonii TaxID=28549 RepID=UPI002EDAEA40|nr:unnamed protein product [Priceomyces carsonii]
MDEEEFNPEYYQHLLSSLNINSRALITELTTIAERNGDQAKVICDLIENRIKKCLPQYKLNALYLLDSICKNVGNPYNIIFGSNLYNIFTETYLVVTDTPTRQNLINLFKTWTNAKTITGSDLFPIEVVQKIEQFIIRATGISLKNHSISNVISPDILLREGNYLLQYIIMLMNNDEKLENLPTVTLDEASKISIKNNNIAKNQYIITINQISESIMLDPKSFEANVQDFHLELQSIRKELDNQNFQQRLLMDKYFNQEPTPTKNLKITIDLTPNERYFKGLDQDIHQDKLLIQEIESWGKTIVQASGVETIEGSDNQKINKESEYESLPAEPTEEPLSASLGMDFGSFNFMDSVLGLPKNETTDVSMPVLKSAEDSYDPEAFEEEPKSSLKRPADDKPRSVKKVRFDV